LNEHILCVRRDFLTDIDENENYDDDVLDGGDYFINRDACQI